MSHWSLNNRGLLLLEEERFDEAADALLAAVRADDSQATFHNNLGAALERLGRLADARDAYAAALERDGEYGKAEVSLARVEPLVTEDVQVAASPEFGPEPR
jgi:Flp pilus assembly protein TadD